LRIDDDGPLAEERVVDLGETGIGEERNPVLILVSDGAEQSRARGDGLTMQLGVVWKRVDTIE
jgi:hypothetical protein